MIAPPGKDDIGEAITIISSRVVGAAKVQIIVLISHYLL
jgi:hypothetical protein